ncbi:hypothetical protein JW960_11715 [candidate division KSB1 bacterium]|nr:hypothetical protein [candidate division KSB1 bacterium]
MKTQNQLLIYLLVLAVLDLVIPFPITAVILIYVIFTKPAWFKQYVDDIYK